MIRGVSHVCFVVSDLERSQRFYAGALGMRPAFDFRNDEGRRTGMYLYAGERTFIELFEGSPAESTDAGSYRHICLEVGDIREAVAALRDAGVETTDPALGSDGSLQAWLEDPDGNRIELHQFQADSKQTKALAQRQ